MITIQDLIQYRRQKETLIERIVSVRMPTEYGEFQMIGYTNEIDEKEHVAFVKGDISPDQPVLVRVHSECLTGDVFGFQTMRLRTPVACSDAENRRSRTRRCFSTCGKKGAESA